MEVIGPRAYLKDDAPGRGPAAAGSRRATAASIILTFGGGTNEVQRDLIAMFGLGFPRSAR